MWVVATVPPSTNVNSLHVGIGQGAGLYARGQLAGDVEARFSHKIAATLRAGQYSNVCWPTDALIFIKTIGVIHG